MTERMTISRYVIVGIFLNLVLGGGLFFLMQTARLHLIGVPLTVRAHPLAGMENFRVEVVLPERFQPPPDKANEPLSPSLFDEQGQTYSFDWHEVGDSSGALRLLIPLTMNAGQVRRFFLEWQTGDPASSSSDAHETIYEEISGSGGENIDSWEIRNVTAMPELNPFEGRSMVQLMVVPGKDEGDHYTNELIELKPVSSGAIDQNTFLSYALFFPRPGNLRVTVQARMGEITSASMTALDQNDLSGAWNTNLNGAAVGTWYYRIIPLGEYAGNNLDGLIIFCNDDPSMSGDELERPTVVYLDAIRIFKGLAPDVSISNPLREFFRAVVAVPRFILFWFSLLFWSVWGGVYFIRHEPTLRV